MKQGLDYIGVTCVFYCHDGKGNFLLQKRSQKCRDEQARWDCGGGAMEFGETFEAAVKREIKEEYCCEVKTLEYAGTSNVIRDNNGTKSHWIALIFTAKVNPKQVQIGDHEKIEEIGWFTTQTFPKPLHSMFRKHFNQINRTNAIKNSR